MSSATRDQGWHSEAFHVQKLGAGWVLSHADRGVEQMLEVVSLTDQLDAVPLASGLD